MSYWRIHEDGEGSAETINPILLFGIPLDFAEEHLARFKCNLAVYLNLPEYFHKHGKNIPRYYYFELVRMLEDTPVEKNLLINKFRSILTKMDDFGIYTKQILIIYIYLLLDTQPVIDLILCHEPFKTVTLKKLTDVNNSELYKRKFPEFLHYISNNFTINKRFFNNKKNSQYRKKMCRIYMKTLVMSHKWYFDTLEKRYSPEGIGAFEAKNNFDISVKIQN
jgi:hypothetical protein